MPVPELNGRHQTAVLWELAGRDEYDEPRIHSPLEITVRWEETRRESRDAEGNTIIIDAQVMTDREIRPGSIMRLGTLAEWTDEQRGLKQVISYDETPDIKGRYFQRNVLLMAYGDALPAAIGTGSGT